MTKRKALGKGLSSLIPETPPASGRNGILQIDVGLIRPNPRQPRKVFDATALEELGASIKTHGLLQPVVVRRQGDGYELILGERRWRAAVASGIPKLPALVRDLDERQRLESALVENLQRQDLNPVEEAHACQQLVNDFELTHDELARRLGKSRPRISNLLRILTLDASVLSQVEVGALSNLGICYELLRRWKDAVQTYDRVITLYEDDRASQEAYKFAKGHRDWIVTTRL